MLPSQTAAIGARNFNATSFIMYWDIVKNYYCNKQEERGFAIHTDDTNILENQAIQYAHIYNQQGDFLGSVFENEISFDKQNTILALGS